MPMPLRRHSALTEDEVLSKMLELDLKKMEMRHERHVWHIKSMWSGLTGLLIAVYIAITTQYLWGNKLFVQDYNYMIIAGMLLLSIAFSYGMMWIGVIREYKKFERIINDKIDYYDDLLSDEKKVALFNR
jgi:hypothetical protein